ncbi:endonuclease/exonuclease/phosphatase family protein [Gelidibacter salicanalis]|uniref:Endonuclease/exonuclease/phosphatase family protein n=1 Tax=Gelidibacter salicanalis TaxID=291193 RepID=A0A5C7AI14_9FLAO|nr:endonuclease/exonuclease/phosphatase family protein [Gelidibacter salicanalis]TXE08390.1 endonuclease/exonuclease/phosphatase family protein [Gelidibacter salicanalis]
MKKIILILLSVIAISCGEVKKQNHPSAKLNIMTFNIRYDNPEDGMNNWQYRKEYVANSILFHDVDILGTQEVLHNQMVDLKKLLPDYESVGVGREDGKEKGEYSALFYKKNRFSVVESGYFWLSATPEIAGSKGWDGACERIASWAKLKDLKSGKEVLTMNTHFDHVGVVARRESVTLILNKLSELANGIPVILMGDFNAEPDSVVIKTILNTSNENHLIDSRSISPLVYGPSWSFHDFGKIPFEKRPLIDYIFISKDIEISKYGVLAETDNDIFLSDHTPILVRVELK